MSLPCSDSAESIWSVLSCASDDYQIFYDNELLTEVLSDEALRNIIGRNNARLREADKAHLWPNSHYRDNCAHIKSASQNGQCALRVKVALRERNYCAITKAFGGACARKLIDEGRVEEIPDNVAQHPMEAAHVIPFLLNKFDDRAISSPQITLVGPNINSPTDAIYMTKAEDAVFGCFKFYLDKEAFLDIPNKYKVRMAREGRYLTNRSSEEEVEFPTLEESSVEPPNPDYLKIHAAFAKVLHLCGAAEYMERFVLAELPEILAFTIELTRKAGAHILNGSFAIQRAGTGSVGGT
ncbi:hypothetical protein BJY52DRAFT_1387270 [Lactarius psammicola]|nr:hypothetical protein BJY52DRAFT_1387270 [Lactarius psammicola]